MPRVITRPLSLALISADKLLIRKTNLKTLDKKVIFVLSTGRTGTQFLAQYFDNFSDIYATHEPTPSRRLRLWSMAYMMGKVSDGSMDEVINKFRSKLLNDVAEKKYLESNNFLAGFAESLKREFDNPIIIHVVRDPRTYITSQINHGADKGLKGFANRHIPYAHINTMTFKAGRSRRVFERTAKYWQLVDETLSLAGEGYQNYHLFKFEELFAPGSKDIQKIAALLGVKEQQQSKLTTKDKVNKSRLKAMGGWQNWTPEMARMVDDICGRNMKKYGYGTEDAWKSKLEGRG